MKRPSFPIVFVIFANMSLLGFINSLRGVSFPLIRNGFNVSYNDMGLMNALISFTAVCSCIAASLFMNRFGLKKTVVSAFLFIILAAGSFYFASWFWMTVVFFLIMQSGAGFFEISLNGTGVRVFTKKSALMMSLLHFFFGAGAICGPRLMGFMVNRMGLSWQEVYPLVLVPAFILLIISLATRFPGKPEPAAFQKQLSFWAALKNPMVWFFGFIVGIASALEGCTVAWGGLFLQDVYGLDPSTFGAAFISVFFMLYTLSRLLSGLIIEKTGYMKSIFVSGIMIIALFLAAFSLGKKGIYLLPVTGFFIAVMWPTALAISMAVFREHSQTVSGAIISIAFTLNGIIQYGFGLINRVLGAAWGYRSCVLYSAILLVLLFLLLRKNKAKGWLPS